MIQDMSGGDTMAMWPHIHPHLIAALTQWADIQIYNLGGSLAMVASSIQGVPKKMSFSGKTAITTFKLIQNAKVGGVLESSGYLLFNGH